MPTPSPLTRDWCNAPRWPVRGGHYESWFVRANHATRPRGLWIRYTIFAPAGEAGQAQGELWAVWFDGEAGRSVAARSEHPIADCRFDPGRLGVTIGGATLDDGGLSGSCATRDHRLAWSLSCAGGDRPLLLLPPGSYTGAFPKAKTLVPRPACRFDGTIEVDSEIHAIDGWLGSQNHNWGPAHADRYAWGQVAGFDGHDDIFLECSSARVKVGPLLTPWLTAAVVRIGDREHTFNAVPRAPLAHVRVNGLRWSFRASNRRDQLQVTMAAAAETIAGLRYRDPPGGAKVCLNSKIAACRLVLRRAGEPDLNVRSEHRAAFELLGVDVDGIALSVCME